MSYWFRTYFISLFLLITRNFSYRFIDKKHILCERENVHSAHGKSEKKFEPKKNACVTDSIMKVQLHMNATVVCVHGQKKNKSKKQSCTFVIIALQSRFFLWFALSCYVFLSDRRYFNWMLLQRATKLSSEFN